MTEPSDIDATARRLQALQAARAASAAPSTTAPSTTAAPKAAARAKSSGPAPGRIVAAAVSVSAGIGLVTLMAGAQQDVVVQVSPTPVTVQPASVIVQMPASATGEQPEIRLVEAAKPAERPSAQTQVVTQSEGS